MYGFRSIIVADGSPAVRELLPLMLAPHGPEVVAVADAEAALAAIERAQAPALVIVDMALPPGGGALLFERCAALGQTRPALLAMTTAPSLDEETRVTLLGAIGYLTKPLIHRDIVHAVRSRHGYLQRSAPRIRALPLLHAEVCDGEKLVQLRWEVLDLSVTGAFLVTRAALPIGTNLLLRLPLPEAAVIVAAEVVRVQEPSWANVGGVGVAFRGTSAEAYSALDRFVEGALANRA